ncbi:unnamed protein product, partial [Staurois parvus]
MIPYCPGAHELSVRPCSTLFVLCTCTPFPIVWGPMSC